MVIVKIMGGLGNQLQQYAVYCKFLSLGIPAKLDLSWFDESEQAKQLKARELELAYFEGLPYEICSIEERERLIGREHSLKDKVLRKLLPNRYAYFQEAGRMYLPEIYTLQEAYLEGYWACEKYYADILEELRRLLVFPLSGQNGNRNREMAEKMQTESSVSVHIRRGDYLDAANAELFGGICTQAYYESAMNYCRERMPKAHFYIFSDDAEYAKAKYVGEEYTVLDFNKGKDSFYDMYLMSQCRHNICANSTFSFWGARLNANRNKIMVRPLKHRNNQQYDRAVMEELWKGWVLLGD